jgi:hypothetical protein
MTDVFDRLKAALSDRYASFLLPTSLMAGQPGSILPRGRRVFSNLSTE